MRALIYIRCISIVAVCFPLHAIPFEIYLRIISLIFENVIVVSAYWFAWVYSGQIKCYQGLWIPLPKPSEFD